MKAHQQEIELENINCNLCGDNDPKYLYSKADTRYLVSDINFRVVQCRKCGLGYINPRPIAACIDDFYPERFYNSRKESKIITIRYEKETRYLRKFGPGRILDIGCAEGGFLHLLQKQGWEVYGMDYADKGMNIYGLNIQYGELDEIKYPSNFFDVVTAWAVFEHLRNPMRYFEEVFRILKTGGTFVILVPNFNSLMSRVGYMEDIPRHLYFFSEKTLRGFAAAVNLQLRAIDYSTDIYHHPGHDAIRIYLLHRWGGVPLESIFAGESLVSFRLRLLNKIGYLIGRYLVRQSLEEKFKISGVIVAELKKV